MPMPSRVAAEGGKDAAGSTSAPTDSGAARLRICVVTVAAGGIGGMQRHTHDLVRGLIAVGHDVEVICPAARGLTNEMYGARWELLDSPGRRDPSWSRLVVDAFRLGESRGSFDVVHSESTTAVPLVLAGVETPVVVKYHGNYVGLAKAHLKRAASRPRSTPRELWSLAHLSRRHFRRGNVWALRDCESIVVSRQQLEDTRRSHLIRRTLMHVVPNGVDTSLFQPGDQSAAREALDLPGGFLFVAVGRLNVEKGFDVAVEALGRIAEHPEAKLVIVGDGDQRPLLDGLTRALGLDERVVFAGSQPQELVASFLVAGDVFLFPTRRDEAGPLVLPQALACGLPVVASRIGGITEVIEPSGGQPVGVLVSPDDVVELESAMRELLADADVRETLSRRARARAVEEYGLEAMVERTVAVYRIAISRAGVARSSRVEADASAKTRA